MPEVAQIDSEDEWEYQVEGVAAMPFGGSDHETDDKEERGEEEERLAKHLKTTGLDDDDIGDGQKVKEEEEDSKPAAQLVEASEQRLEPQQFYPSELGGHNDKDSLPDSLPDDSAP
jgi:hypothetical protein